MSQGPFRSLNLGFATGDDPSRVRSNRLRWFEACGIDADRVIAGEQVHGGGVAHVCANDGGRGALDPATSPRATDGLWTETPGIYLMAISADCPLVVIYEPDRSLVAVVHAGWRGAAAGIVENATDAISAAGGDRSRMWAGVSPAIGPCCYPVGEEAAARLSARQGRGPWITPDREGFRVDLKAFLRLELITAGLSSDAIALSPRCSACEPESLYSYRRDGGRTGRIAVVAGIRS